MNKRLFIKSISLLLLISMLLLSFSVRATVNNNDNNKKTQTQIRHKVMSNKYDLKNLPKEIKDALNVDLESVKSIKHSDADNSNIISLENEDGTITQKIFDKPIKYEENGEIKFIDNTIKEVGSEDVSDYKYENTTNSFKTYFSEKIENGVLIENDEENYSVEMKPVTDSNTTAFIKEEIEELSNTNNVVEYDNAFDETSRLYYEATATGVKESMILEEYNGIDSYNYIIKTDLVPKNMVGSTIEFKNQDSNETVAKISETFIVDSVYAEEPNDQQHITYNNNYTIAQISENEYLLTVKVDTKFLTADTTVYPVNVDPSFDFISPYKTEKGLRILQTTTVYSGDKNYIGYSDKWNQVGKSSGKGVGISYVKIHLPDQARIIDSNNISSAYFETYEGSGNTSSSKINLFGTKTPDWKINEVNYSNRPALNDTATSSVTIKQSGWKKFNITALAKQWIAYLLNEGGYTCDRGFALKAADNTIAAKHFSSHNNTDYNISITINYTEEKVATGQYYLQNVHSGMMLDLSSNDNESVIQYSLHGKVNQKWNITDAGNGSYKIESQQERGAYLVKDKDLYKTSPTARKAMVSYTGFNEVMIRKNKDGTYRIFKVAEDEIAPKNATWDCLEVYYGSTDEWAQTTWYPYKGTANQKWILVKVNDITIYRNVNAASLEYNRTQARHYAYLFAEYYDGIYDTPDFLMTIDGGNCTNFVSACLYNGNLEEIGNFTTEIEYQLNKAAVNYWCYNVISGKYRASLTWANAENFAKHWGHNGNNEGRQRCYMTIKFNTLKTAKKYLNFMSKISNAGDVLQLFNSDRVWHSMIIVDVDRTNNIINRAQHTVNKIETLNSYLNDNENKSDGILLHLIKKGDG